MGILQVISPKIDRTAAPLIKLRQLIQMFQASHDSKSVDNSQSSLAVFPFSQDQHQKLLPLIQPSPHINPTTSSVNALTLNFSVIPDMAGTHSCSTSTSIDRFTSLIDTGATDHVICSLNLFTSYKSVSNLFVNLPNSQKVPVTYVATVRSTSYLSLFDALYVPTFNFNLISASKLSYKTHYCLLFQPNLCITKDLNCWKMIGLARQTKSLLFRLAIQLY